MTTLLENAVHHLDVLCNEIKTRQVGSSGNRQAAAYAADTLRSLGYQVETPSFNCVDWVGGKAELHIADQDFEVLPSPYSLPCHATASLRTAGTLTDLQAVECKDEILLLHSELAREQIMPKNFPFYNPELHQLIVSLVEGKSPAAVVAATSRNPELAGAVYPFPLFEDGDFNIPSVYTTEEVGQKLLPFTGKQAILYSQAERIPSTGCNVIGRLNPGSMSKITVCAHIDAKIGTPGALDNAAGVVTLLLIADLLQDYSGSNEIELLVMNGEDYYGANGEKQYLAQNEGKLGRILSFINIDAPGFHTGKTAFSFYNQTEERISSFRSTLQKFPEIFEGESWYQGDHMALVMNGVPAVAITSEKFVEIEQYYAHTAKDDTSLVDRQKLIETARAVQMIIQTIE